MGKNLLLTGASGIGKTTLIRKVAEACVNRNISGFVTDEIRVRGRREGFHLETFEGQRSVLAHTGMRSRYRVGKYGVDVAALERVVDTVLALNETVDLYLVDEIGRMECFSKHFINAMIALLDSDHLVIATIHRKAGGFVQEVKNRSDVELWWVTRETRDQMIDQVLAWIQR